MWQPRIMFLSSALHSLVFPVFLAISFQWYFVGPMKRSQRLAAKPLVSYSLVNRRWQRRSDHESKHRIRTRKLLAPPTSLSRLQPRPSSPIMEERREGFPDRLKGVTTLHTIRNWFFTTRLVLGIRGHSLLHFPRAFSPCWSVTPCISMSLTTVDNPIFIYARSKFSGRQDKSPEDRLGSEFGSLSSFENVHYPFLTQSRILSLSQLLAMKEFIRQSSFYFSNILFICQGWIIQLLYNPASI